MARRISCHGLENDKALVIDDRAENTSAGRLLDARRSCTAQILVTNLIRDVVELEGLAVAALRFCGEAS